MRRKKSVKSRIISGVLVLLLAFMPVAGSLALPASNVYAAEVPKGAGTKIKAFAKPKITAYANHAISQVIDGIADQVDNEYFSKVISFIDIWILGQGQSKSFSRITSLCTDILEKVDEIEKNQAIYADSIMSTIGKDQIQSARKTLSNQIEADITDAIDQADVETVMASFTDYMKAVQEYKDNGTDYQEAEKTYLADLYAIYGSYGRVSDAQRVQLAMTTDVIDVKLRDCINELSSKLCPKSKSSYNVADCAAQLAYLYYPWSPQQYEFITYEIDFQLQQIMLLEMIYQDLVGRQYTYMLEHNYFTDGFTNAFGKQVSADTCSNTYEANVYYLNECNSIFANNLADMLDRPLKVSDDVTLKLSQYYKSTDRAMSFQEDWNTRIYNANFKESFNLKDEKDGYLYDDFHGGPMEAINENNFYSSMPEEANYGVMSAHFYPVVRNGGVDIYYLARYENNAYGTDGVTLSDLYGEISVWPWYSQHVPRVYFWNLAHGVFYENASYDNGNGVKNEYRMAVDGSEVQGLFQSNAFNVDYNYVPEDYLGLDRHHERGANLIIYKYYEMTANHSSDGYPQFYATDTGETQPAGVITAKKLQDKDLFKKSEFVNQDMAERNIRAILMPVADDTAAAISVTASAGGTASIDSGTKASSDSNGYKAGELLTLKVNPDSGKIPGEITCTDNGETKVLIDEGAVSSLPVESDGSYSVMVAVPYFGGTINVSFVDDDTFEGVESSYDKLHFAGKMSAEAKELENSISTDASEIGSAIGDARITVAIILALIGVCAGCIAFGVTKKKKKC